MWLDCIVDCGCKGFIWALHRGYILKFCFPSQDRTCHILNRTSEQYAQASAVWSDCISLHISNLLSKCTTYLWKWLMSVSLVIRCKCASLEVIMVIINH